MFTVQVSWGTKVFEMIDFYSENGLKESVEQYIGDVLKWQAIKW